jgi:hypothetical protein
VVVGKAIFEATRHRWDLVIADGPPIGQVLSLLRAPSTIQGLVPAGRVERQAAWMRGVLEDPAQTGLVVVTLAEELPMSETAEVLAALEAEPVAPVAGVVVNRLLPPLEVAPAAVETVSPGPRREAARLHLALERSQQRWLERLPSAARLPYLFGIFTPAEVAARLADDWVVP